jgi:hypothetical protein
VTRGHDGRGKGRSRATVRGRRDRGRRARGCSVLVLSEVNSSVSQASTGAAAHRGLALGGVGGDTKTERSRRTIALPALRRGARSRTRSAVESVTGRGHLLGRHRLGLHDRSRHCDERGQCTPRLPCRPCLPRCPLGGVQAGHPGGGPASTGPVVKQNDKQPPQPSPRDLRSRHAVSQVCSDVSLLVNRRPQCGGPTACLLSVASAGGCPNRSLTQQPSADTAHDHRAPADSRREECATGRACGLPSPQYDSAQLPLQPSAQGAASTWFSKLTALPSRIRQTCA